jgi:GNAT superfamily N-acetyltransferase
MNNASPIVEYAPGYMDQVVAVIGRGLRQQKVLPEGDEPIEDEDLHHIPEIFAGRGRFWVCLKDDVVIGTVAVQEMSETTAQLKCMFVESAYHGQGIGQQLFDQALDFVRAQQYNEMTLTRHPFMKRAHRFYERNGFRRVADENGLYAYQMNL